jgi:fructuronate reductase
VHLGVGAFARAHQAWYTAHAADAQEWGIVGFTGRSPRMSGPLTAQDGLYTVIERGPVKDRFEIVPNLVAVHPGDRVDLLVQALSAPATAIVTLTITESGYRVASDGRPNLNDPAVVADVEVLRSTFAGRPVDSPAPATAIGRLLLGLSARRSIGAPPLAVVPCDNMPQNGQIVRRALIELAELVSPSLADWIPTEVSFVSTSVDRITPRTDPQDLIEVAKVTGWEDASPVVTEPFSDWVLSGEFPSGRPMWETAGARFVADVQPYEGRKLWMLNGAHSLLSSLGRLRGHETVDEAIADPVCRAAVERLWDDDERHLPPDLELTSYRAALLERFGNPRIQHRLEQIAVDGLTKLQLRVVPVAQREIATGGTASGCVGAIAAWIASEEAGLGVQDAASERTLRRTDGDLRQALLFAVSPDLAGNRRFAGDVMRTLSAGR